MDLYQLLATLTAMAPAPEGAEQEGHTVVMLLFYVGLFAIFYFLLIRPQSKRSKETRNMQESLSKGDRIVTTGGIYATVHKVDDDKVTLEIAEGVRIKAQKSAVFEIIGDKSSSKEDEKK